ncbi:hypothetical protein [Streptomyces uncialis]|uniref:hypothetical protein n=1 Tax=Streptomyces uncialis TaxID=1048205 RepID=UPI00224D1137|nr:hypothetical protein [Streptomyces uncialis]MCX4659347.1 hypothetical protein [Streptomyces uncialis]WST67452.1 hypothetical protein OG268_07965 [Streptomyces uncialis]
MDDSARMWITAVPPFGPDDTGVLLALDHDSQDPGELTALALLDRGHEGEEGVFYLLPFDLAARYERVGDRLAVRITASREVLADEPAGGRGPGGPAAGLPPDADDADRVTLLRRELVTDFVPSGPDGEKQGVLLIDHPGPASLPELFARFERGESGFAVLNAS